MPPANFVRPKGRNASLDAVLEFFGACLPEYGFKLVGPPPNAGNPSYAIASVWRHGEAQVATHKAATAALALLQATQSEVTRLRDASGAAACNRCSGIGWFVTNKGAVDICRHATGSFAM